MADADSPGDRSTGWRLIGVVALALVALFQLLILIVDVPGVRGHIDWFLNDPGNPMAVTYVPPGGVAQRAGVRAGDVIDLNRLYPQRKTMFDPVISWRGMAGDRIDVPITRKSTQLTIPITLGSTVPLPFSITVAEDIGEVVTAATILLAGWLVSRRPSIMTWSLYGFLLSNSANDSQTLNRFGWSAALVDNLVIALLQAAVAFIIVFAIRAPNDTTSRWRNWVAGLAIALFVVAFLNAAYPIVAWSVLGFPQRYAFPPAWIGNAASTSIFIVTVGALALNYVHAHGTDRERLKWIVLGVTLAVAPSLVFQLVPDVNHWLWALMVLTTVYTAGIAAIGYAILRGRIVDVKFVVSRAVVAAILAGSVVVAFAVVDWLVSKNLQASRLGAFTEIGLAIALGFWFNALHRGVDTFVDRTFFRRRYEAEKQLTLAAHAVLHSTCVETIREVLVDEPASAFDLASAAIFEPLDGSTWRRTREIGWDCNTILTLTGDDALLRHVKAEQIVLRISSIHWHALRLPGGSAHPVIAVPILARRNVVAIALYGQHQSGVDLDLDEVHAIERVAEAAGAAYDHVEAETFRRKYEELESRLAHLQ